MDTPCVMLVKVYLYIIPEHEPSRDMFEEGKKDLFSQFYFENQLKYVWKNKIFLELAYYGNIYIKQSCNGCDISM